jgi:5-methylcytosine-specific restriction endonuclease McrA
VKHIDEENFRKICNESKSMADASKFLNMHFTTFKRWAIKLDCYNTNQCGKGIQKPLKHYENTKRTHHVKNKLWSLGLKQKVCEVCGIIDEYNGKPLTLEIHHIDGNKKNNVLENLQILCPNCHSQTETYRRKKSSL